MKPEVSIIMPTFNRAHFLKEALEGIVNQTFHEWECLIIDDGSTDNTREILQPFLQNDLRFKYFERSEAHLPGPAGCRNQGIDLAKGHYIVFFDSDDVFHPDLLETSLDLVNSSDDFKFCNYGKMPFSGSFSDQSSIVARDEKENIKIIDIENLEDVVTQKIGFACCTVLWDRMVLGRERFNEELTYAEEWEFYIRLLSKNIKGISTHKILYFNRKHPDSNTGQFWSKDPVRRASKIQAVELVLGKLKSRKFLSPKIVKHFLRLGLGLNEKEILTKTLEASDAGLWKKTKYIGGYFLYPLFKSWFVLRRKIHSS